MGHHMNAALHSCPCLQPDTSLMLWTLATLPPSFSIGWGLPALLHRPFHRYTTCTSFSHRHDSACLAFQHIEPWLRSCNLLLDCERNGWTIVVLTTSVHRDAAQFFSFFFYSMPASRCPRCRSHCWLVQVQRTRDHHLLSFGQVQDLQQQPSYFRCCSNCI